MRRPAVARPVGVLLLVSAPCLADDALAIDVSHAAKESHEPVCRTRPQPGLPPAPVRQLVPDGAAVRVFVLGRYNLTVAKSSLGDLMTKSDFGTIFGVGTTIWGIFELSAHAYTEILFGADNIFDIAGFRPIGLFSWGAGMRIPMGDFSLIMDWQSFYTGIGYSEVSDYCDSYKYGIAIDLSDVFSLEFYSRTLFNFSETAIGSDLIDIESSEDRIQIIGAGAVLHLF